jgi:hypothetical protein
MFDRGETEQSKLLKLKKSVENSYQSFLQNFNRYNQFMKFVFKTSLTTDDLTKLDILQKPPLEFNILEAIVSRMRGEFSKHEPSINMRASEGVSVNELDENLLKTIEVIEKHFRAIFNDATNDCLDYNFYTDLLAGGFSAAYIYTDYVNEMSFNQNIKVKRVFDPTLIGFDPLARESHKGDGSYCFQLIPKTKEEFQEEYGEEITKEMKFIRNTNLRSFNWSYQNQDRDIVLVAEFFYKVRKKEKLAKLSNGHTILFKHYERFMELWNEQGFIEQAPIVIETRRTIIETIERCIFCENKILKQDKTVYKHLPIVFIDGNSVNVRDSDDNSSVQVTRPLVYHAEGIQKLLNFAGQTVAAEIENMVQHKMIVAVESIPKDYVDAYKNIQQMSNFVYNAYYEGNAQQPNPPPREVQRTATPPIVENVFNGSSTISQTILGSYDGLLGISDQQVSGVAIQQGAMQSNAAGLPYLVGYIKGQNRIAEIVMDLIPKFYVTPRSIPIMEADGKRSYQLINHPESEQSIDMKYDPNGLQCKVEAGISSAVQKQVALDQIIRMMQSSEVFAAFINRDGLEIIIDNLDIRGVDTLKAQAAKFMQELKQKEEQAAQQGPQQDPMVEIQQQQVQAYHEIEMSKVQQQQMKIQGDLAIQAAKVSNEKQALEIKYMEVMAKLGMENKRIIMEEEKTASSDSRHAVESAIKIAEHMRGE